MARLTRSEAKEHTRQRILDAAAARFLDGGFHATSLEQIADDAGHSTGAVYSNFGGKSDLALEVVEALYTREGRRLLSAVARAEPGTLEQWLAALGEWAATVLGDPRWARFEVELAGTMSAGREHQQALSDRYARMRTLFAEGLRTHTTNAPQSQPDTTGTLMVALLLGLAIQRTVDPDIPAQLLIDGFKALCPVP